jgi:hypothetical protein
VKLCTLVHFYTKKGRGIMLKLSESDVNLLTALFLIVCGAIYFINVFVWEVYGSEIFVLGLAYKPLYWVLFLIAGLAVLLALRCNQKK